MGRSTARYFHPVISDFIASIQADLTSNGQVPSLVEQTVIDLEEEWSHKHIADGEKGVPTDPPPPPVLGPTRDLDPLPLMSHHPPRIMDSNTRITLREDSLSETLPRNKNGLGWIQIQQKSLRWEEHIRGSSVITHEGLTTLTHPNRGWTIASGTWNDLRETMGTYRGNVTENLRLLCYPKATGEGQQFHPYETYLPDDDKNLSD